MRSTYRTPVGAGDRRSLFESEYKAEFPVSEEMLDSMRKGSQVAMEGELRVRSGRLEVRVKAIRDLEAGELTEAEYSPTHYLRLTGESEEDGLRRLIAAVTKWASEPDRADFWKIEVKRLTAQLKLLQKQGA